MVPRQHSLNIISSDLLLITPFFLSFLFFFLFFLFFLKILNKSGSFFLFFEILFAEGSSWEVQQTSHLQQTSNKPLEPNKPLNTPHSTSIHSSYLKLSFYRNNWIVSNFTHANKVGKEHSLQKTICYVSFPHLANDNLFFLLSASNPVRHVLKPTKPEAAMYFLISNNHRMTK